MPPVRMASASLSAALARYSAFQPTPLTLEKLLQFGRGATEARSYDFLRKELPVRFANILSEIQHLPDPIFSVPSIQTVHGWYSQTFKDVLDFESKKGHDERNLEDFNQAISVILRRHETVVETLAQGILELRQQIDSKSQEQNMQYFLDRFYTNRISCRMLINQHKVLFADGANERRHIGSIDPHCDAPIIIEDAYENARYLCEQYYMDSPSLDIVEKNATEEPSLEITYVPSHLYHILFELLKNSMRAVMESHGEDTVSYPPIRVLVVKGKEDITIRVSDEGGGIPRSHLPLLFNYMYSTAPQPVGGEQLAGSAPLAGYGYGLPLSRLYARYFKGDLIINSTEGFGTDAYIYLKTVSSDATELLPIFNKTTSKYYKTNTNQSDWSSPVPGN